MTTANIVVLATGGTISSTASTTSHEHTNNGLSPSLSGEDLLRTLPSDHPFVVQKNATIHVNNVYHKDSSQLLPTDIDRLTDAVLTALDAGATGIVVVHGTDTLESTALWLQLVCPLAHYHCPLAITGATFAADSSTPDGPQNLADALSYVTNPQAESTVKIVFGGAILPAWGALKLATDQRTAFASVCPANATSTGLTELPVDMPIHPIPRLSVNTPLVRIVTVDFGDDGSLLRLACEPSGAVPVRAIIIEALGSGNLPAATATVLHELRTTYPEIIFVVTSRVPLGPVSALYGCTGGGADLAAAGIPLIKNLRAPQCRILLLALLQAGYSTAQIKNILHA